jgi:hypothetical protein
LYSCLQDLLKHKSSHQFVWPCPLVSLYGPAWRIKEKECMLGNLGSTSFPPIAYS